MKKLRVLVLMHSELVPPESIAGVSDAEMAPWKMEYDVLAALHNLGHEVHALGVEDALAPIREAIEEWRPHIAFNLLMHFHGIGIYDAHVVSYLELLKTPYTGCNPRGILLASDKALSKKILSYHRIPIPGFANFRRGKTVRTPRKLCFPLFVKSTVEHSSMGISQASIVQNEESLVDRVQFIHRTVGTDAIAEEYIQGRELTIGVLGNQRLTTFPVWELRFTKLRKGAAPIATARVKWDLDYQEKIGLRSGIARDLPDGKAQEIAHLARRVYRALGLTGFSRIDLRLNEAGQAYVIEANPNPDLCFGEDFSESAEAAGIPYLQLIQRILNLGLRHTPAWKQG